MDIATAETIVRNLVNYALFVIKQQPTCPTPGKPRFYPDTINQAQFCDSIFYNIPAVKPHGQEETDQWTYEIMQRLSNYRPHDFPAISPPTQDETNQWASDIMHQLGLSNI